MGKFECGSAEFESRIVSPIANLALFSQTRASGSSTRLAARAARTN